MQFDKVGSVGEAEVHVAVLEVEPCMPSHLEAAQMFVAHLVLAQKVHAAASFLKFTCEVANHTVNVGVNLVRMLGQAAISNTIAGIIDMRNDGLTTMGAIEHYWGRQTPVGKTMTVVAAGFAGVYVYYWARSAIESFLSIYNDMRNIYNESAAKNQAQAAGTAALAA